MRAALLVLILLSRAGAAAANEEPSAETIRGDSDRRVREALADFEREERVARSATRAGAVALGVALTSLVPGTALLFIDHDACVRTHQCGFSYPEGGAGLALTLLGAANLIVGGILVLAGIPKAATAKRRHDRLVAREADPDEKTRPLAREERERADLLGLLAQRTRVRAILYSAAWVAAAAASAAIWTAVSQFVAESQTCTEYTRYYMPVTRHGYECGGFWPSVVTPSAGVTGAGFAAGGILAGVGAALYETVGDRRHRLFPTFAAGPQGGSVGLTLAF